MRKIFIIGIVVVLAVYMLVRLNREPMPIAVSVPASGDVISSPFSLSGKARGYWYFEASFPVRVLDANGNELGVGVAQALDEWMTEAFVPFAGTVEFQTPKTPTGKVVFQKDDPSGLTAHDAAVEVPVRFRK